MARAAAREAEKADRLDLRVRALGLEGLALAKRGDHAAGLDVVTRGLALALEHELTAVAAELYQRLGAVVYDSAEYRAPTRRCESALALCDASGAWKPRLRA